MLGTLLIDPDHHCGLDPFPWGPLSVGSYLRHLGREVRLLSASLLTDEEFDSALASALPEVGLVGISCFSTDVDWVLGLMRRIKAARPELPIILGGPHAILLPEQTASHELVDFIAFGPGEETTAGLLEALEANTPPVDVPGLIWKEDGGLRKNEPAPPPPDYPIDYDLLPEHKKATFGRYLEVLSGRGCSFSCAFCYNAVCGHKWRGKSAESLIAEIEPLVERYDPELIYFRDENFFHSRKRILAFLDLYRQKGFRFKWHATCRANYFNPKYIDEAFLNRLVQANCVKLKFGMESGSQSVLDILRKGIKVEQIRNVATTLAQSPIVGNYSFLTAVPGETRQDFYKTLELIEHIVSRDTAAEIIGPQYYRIYPGGELYEHIIDTYDYRPPQSFEAWAEAARGDLFGLSKDADHPWMQGGKTLSRLADVMVMLRRKPLGEMLTLRKLPAVPFALLARLRMRTGFFSMLLDMRVAAWLFSAYVQRIYLPGMKENRSKAQ